MYLVMHHVWKVLFALCSQEVSAQEAATLFKAADSNSNGRIDFSTLILCVCCSEF